jgi:hypothetical protein
LVIPVLQKILAWSFSRYMDYHKCPALAKYKHVLKLKEPDNEAMAGGTLAHKQAEDYTTGKLKKLPERCKQFPKEFAALRKAKALVEQQWAFNRKWEEVSWFAKDAWLRIKVDAHTLQGTKVHIVDHKTGKEHEPDHGWQRDLYALGALLKYLWATEVVAEHWYLDAGVARGGDVVYTFKDLPRLKQEWVDRTANMLQDTRFAPCPGHYCKWCHFRRDNGGPCKF